MGVVELFWILSCLPSPKILVFISPLLPFSSFFLFLLTPSSLSPWQISHRCRDERFLSINSPSTFSRSSPPPPPFPSRLTIIWSYPDQPPPHFPLPLQPSLGLFPPPPTPHFPFLFDHHLELPRSKISPPTSLSTFFWSLLLPTSPSCFTIV